MSDIANKFQPLASAVLSIAALLGVYFGVLTLVSGWSFTTSQFVEVWPYISHLQLGLVCRSDFISTLSS